MYDNDADACACGDGYGGGSGGGGIIVSVEPVCVEKQLLRLLSLVRFHPPSTNMNACSTCNDCVSTAKRE